MIQDMLPPRLWDRSGRCAAHLGERRPVVYALEVADRGLDVFAAPGGVGLDAVGDFEEQFPGTPPLSPQLVVGLALCGLGDSLHLGHGALELGTGTPSDIPTPQFI